MGWDKNTINVSKIDPIIETLDSLKVPYSLTVKGQVQGFGNNDDFNSGVYSVRVLTYADKVFVEVLESNYDCDADDYFRSVECASVEEAQAYPLSYYNHDPDYCDGVVERAECSCRKE